jgi:hypothetical protein
MKKNILLGILLISFIIEAVLAVLCFFYPTKALELFGLVYTEQANFLGYIIAWFCLLVTILIGYCIVQLKNNSNGFGTLLYILCFWWIAIGVGVFIKFGTTDNLLLDSGKGLLLLLATVFYHKK